MDEWDKILEQLSNIKDQACREALALAVENSKAALEWGNTMLFLFILSIVLNLILISLAMLYGIYNK